MGRTVLLSYASQQFRSQQERLAASALAVGFDEAISMSPEDIQSSAFWGENKAIMESKRGAGYWLWKPYIIRETLERLGSGEVLFYCDAGRTGYYAFSRFPTALLRRVRSEPDGFLTGVCVPHFGPLGIWTKRDCLTLMNATEIANRPAIQATWSIWSNTGPALRFLDLWLAYGKDSRCITDEPNVMGLDNLPGFIDHRHDQAISSILTYTLEAPYIDLRHTRLHTLLKVRPMSKLGGLFAKRPQNVDDLLRGLPAPIAVGREAARIYLGRA